MSNNKTTDKATKKFVQPCLPFKLVNSPGDDVNSKCRKRKLSGTENDDSRVENPKVELVNGGTKCFIKSEDEPKQQNLEVITKLIYFSYKYILVKCICFIIKSIIYLPYTYLYYILTRYICTNNIFDILTYLKLSISY